MKNKIKVYLESDDHTPEEMIKIVMDDLATEITVKETTILNWKDNDLLNQLKRSATRQTLALSVGVWFGLYIAGSIFLLMRLLLLIKTGFSY